MITYVNTVLVSNQNGTQLATSEELEGVASKASLSSIVGKFAFMNCDLLTDSGEGTPDIYDNGVPFKTFKIGVVTSDFFTKFNKATGETVYVPKVKWSNEIKVDDIRSFSVLTYKDDTEDTVVVDFSGIDADTANLLALGGIPVILRLTFKDMPTRYRNWTESYDYYTKPGDTGVEIAAGLAKAVNSETRRARVYAQAPASGDNAGKLILTAMPYDDDDSNESENFTSKVRFNANCWYSNPQAAGFASNNKYALGSISKIAGINYPASAKNVRDHERTAQGYQGILHRCKWYDPKPAITANINYKYGGITLEFENMYRAADDIFRKTKQTVEIYASNNGLPIAPAAIGGGILGVIGLVASESGNAPFKQDNVNAYDPEVMGSPSDAENAQK